MVRTDWSAKVLFINTIIKGYTVKQAVSRGTLLRVRRGTVVRDHRDDVRQPGFESLGQAVYKQIQETHSAAFINSSLHPDH